jgi:hypothetical protein
LAGTPISKKIKTNFDGQQNRKALPKNSAFGGTPDFRKNQKP